jgi:hypothetical protein
MEDWWRGKEMGLFSWEVGKGKSIHNQAFYLYKRPWESHFISLAMEERRFEWFGGEGRRCAWEKRREKGEKCFSPNLERERIRENEIFSTQKHINILFREITIMPLPLNVLNPTLILFP